jgi:acyl-coenzyme A synthetase/AMP-(fatty) acid ligase
VEDALLVAGRRVHPAPIEDEVRERAGVRDAALVQPAPGAAPALFAEAGDRPADLDRLAALCRARLGDVTTEIHLVDELPRNPNGKVLRHQLRGMAAAARVVHDDPWRGAAAGDLGGMRRRG